MPRTTDPTISKDWVGHYISRLTTENVIIDANTIAGWTNARKEEIIQAIEAYYNWHWSDDIINGPRSRSDYFHASYGREYAEAVISQILDWAQTELGQREGAIVMVDNKPGPTEYELPEREPPIGNPRDGALG